MNSELPREDKAARENSPLSRSPPSSVQQRR